MNSDKVGDEHDINLPYIKSDKTDMSVSRRIKYVENEQDLADLRTLQFLEYQQAQEAFYQRMREREAKQRWDDIGKRAQPLPYLNK